jgi:hypothetical protein
MLETIITSFFQFSNFLLFFIILLIVLGFMYYKNKYSAVELQIKTMYELMTSLTNEQDRLLRIVYNHESQLNNVYTTLSNKPEIQKQQSTNKIDVEYMNETESVDDNDSYEEDDDSKSSHTEENINDLDIICAESIPRQTVYDEFEELPNENINIDVLEEVNADDEEKSVDFEVDLEEPEEEEEEEEKVDDLIMDLQESEGAIPRQKTIIINQNNDVDTIDYDKMHVKVLKNLVTEKQLATNVSKLKKNELVSLLKNHKPN